MSFVPARTIISDITRSFPAVVTTSTDHGLVSGQCARLNIPLAYGMSELNKVIAVVTVISSNTFSIQTSEYPFPQNIDSRGFQPFVTPANVGTQPEVVPVGSSPVLNATNNYFETQTFDQTSNIQT